jgi:hypothetical protein
MRQSCFEHTSVGQDGHRPIWAKVKLNTCKGAAKSEKEPQPHPISNTDCPPVSSALVQIVSSALISASSRVSLSVTNSQHEYFLRGLIGGADRKWRLETQRYEVEEVKRTINTRSKVGTVAKISGEVEGASKMHVCVCGGVGAGVGVGAVWVWVTSAE